MTSSVISARLEFQCGHAALVSLPRIKGESYAQRAERIASEKTAARARACDFCGPDVAIVVRASAPDLEVVRESVLEPAIEAVLEEILEAPVFETHMDDQPVAEEQLVEAAVVEELALEAALELPIIEPVVVELDVVEVEVAVDVVAEAVAEIVALVEAEAETTREPAPARRARRARSAGAVARELRKFTVQYRVEQLIAADDIGDALRRVTQLGATDVLAIRRE